MLYTVEVVRYTQIDPYWPRLWDFC